LLERENGQEEIPEHAADIGHIDMGCLVLNAHITLRIARRRSDGVS
jgi:hypothetical protein